MLDHDTSNPLGATQAEKIASYLEDREDELLDAGRSVARLVIDAGEAVAAADGHRHPRERRILQLIRIALGPKSPPSAPRPHPAGGAR